VYLSDARKGYLRRRDSIRQQVQLLSSAYEAKKKGLSGNETGAWRCGVAGGSAGKRLTLDG
jgi:hypothetical protein